MSIRNLDRLFRPASIAVVGASTRPGSVGATVMHNLLADGFEGPVMPVNPKHRAVAGVLAYPEIAALPLVPDLAVICTPAPTVPGLIADLGRRGTKAAIVLSAGLSVRPEGHRLSYQEAMLKAARPHLLRILGPNCIGLLVPGSGLNASFAHIGALAGRVAIVHQSGALCTALLDWAAPRGIGFSHVVTLGNSADVDFGDVLDYLGSDPAARAILLYIESVRHARKFMSAARAAARNKPVLVIKAGREPEGARAAASHTGAMAGSDDVYDAAIRRAGMLRVFETEEMFDALETLSRAGPLRGDRLAILTNGGGPGVLATDALIAGGGRLAELDQATLERLDGVLPPMWSKGNPVDIIGDAPGARYRAALEILTEAPAVDGVLVLHAPTATASPDEAAEAVIGVVEARRQSPRQVLTCWLGAGAVAAARRAFAAAAIPTYETPAAAVRAFMHIVRYRRNQELLMETPPSIPTEFTADAGAARKVIDAVLAEGREFLDETEAKAVLAAYGVPVVETRRATTPEEAVACAEAIGYPVALKVLSPDIVHKSDVGGVRLNLDTGVAVADAATAMLARLAMRTPPPRITGFSVQRMVRIGDGVELIVGAATDPVFGPILLFGHGGTAVEVIADRAVGLPPLNLALARELVSRTRVARLLAGYRERPSADIEAVHLSLVEVSQLIADVAEIVELDINPLIAGPRGVVALDARIRIAPATGPAEARLAIRPYPEALEETARLRSGQRVLMRPIRPEDEPAHHRFLARLAPEDIYFRFFGQVRELPHSQMARFTQIDYDREMAFIAKPIDGEEGDETLGVVRVITDPDNERAEFAIVVRSDLKGQGLGRLLLDKMIRYCRSRGTRAIVGQVLHANRAMRGLARELGFVEKPLPEGDAVEVVLDLKKRPT